MAKNRDYRGISTQYEAPVVLLKKWVDFSYEVDRKIYEYSLAGGGSMLLSELVEVLGVIDGTEFASVAEFINHVVNVEFSDESLVKVVPMKESADSDYELVIVDWTLESLKAFDTKEILTITMDNDELIFIHVTDAQDITQFITNINFYKIDSDGTARKTDTFNDGDHAKVQIDFSIDSNALDGTNRTMVYQLPSNIQIETAIDTVARNNNGERVGTFRVTTNGQIELVFDDDYDISQAFEGEIVFNSVVKNTNGGSDQTVNFTDSIGITIKGEEQPKNTDLSIAKSGELNEDNTKINYNIQISSRKGSDGTINFSDWLYENGVDLTYDLSNGQSLNLTKTDENGNTTTVTATVIQDGDSFRLENLPALDANESYSFSYSATVGNITGENGYSSASNSARAEDNSNGQTATSWQEVSTSEISKNATVESGKVKWTVYVGRNGEDISGFIFTDTLTANNTSVEAPSLINVNGTDVTFSGSYTFPAGSQGTAVIIYYTDYDSSNPQQFHNEAKVITEDHHEYKTGLYYTPGQTTPEETTYGVTKWSPTTYADYDARESTTEEQKYVQYKEDGTAILKWTAAIEMPLYGKDLSQITYTDKMTSSDAFGNLSGEHYSTAKLLNSSLVIWCGSAGTPLTRGLDYNVYDSDGNIISADSTDTSFLTGFTIRFLSTANFADETVLSLSYQTIADLDMNVGEKWTFTNRGKIPAASSTVNWDYTKKGKLDKQTSAEDQNSDKRSNADNSYHSGMTEIDYQQGII